MAQKQNWKGRECLWKRAVNTVLIDFYFAIGKYNLVDKERQMVRGARVVGLNNGGGTIEVVVGMILDCGEEIVCGGNGSRKRRAIRQVFHPLVASHWGSIAQIARQICRSHSHEKHCPTSMNGTTTILLLEIQEQCNLNAYLVKLNKGNALETLRSVTV